jgi:predicted anti-sigma-YlaC factor YlaD
LSCQKAQELIHGYLDGELDLLRSVELEKHIHECEICENVYRNQTALRSSLRDESLYHHAPDKLNTRIQTSLRKQSKN